MQISDEQPEAASELRCPKCFNTHAIKDGVITLRGRNRAYDILHDTFGLTRCPACSFRAGKAEFRIESRTTAQDACAL